MARHDGEDWLEGRPFGRGPAPAEREEARSRLRDWRWWALIVGLAAVLGLGAEIGGLLFGREFSVADVITSAMTANISLVVVTWLVARDTR